MNFNQLMKQAQVKVDKNPMAMMQLHLAWDAKGAEEISLFQDGTGPKGRVVATGASGTIAEFKAQDVLVTAHAMKHQKVAA